MFKRKMLYGAVCLSLSLSHVEADMKLHIVNQSDYTIEIPRTNCGAGYAESNTGCYWGAEGSGPENKWTNNPPPIDTPLSINASAQTNINLSHAAGTTGTLTSVLQLNIYDQVNHYVETCYLVNANLKDAPYSHRNQGLENYLLGQYKEKNGVATFQPDTPLNDGDNNCNLIWADIDAGTGENPDIYIRLDNKNPIMQEINKPQVTNITLLTPNYNGQPLYRVDFQSGMVKLAFAANSMNMVHVEPGSIKVGHGNYQYFLLPSKVLTYYDDNPDHGNFNGYDVATSRGSLYVTGPLGDKINLANQIEGVSLIADTAKSPTTYPSGEANLNAADFAIGLTALLPTTQGQTAVLNNGMNQTPVQVEIYYMPEGSSCSPTSSCMISADYHPELMYLYSQVYFTDAISNQLISNIEPNANTQNYTTISNYPGPYVTVPGNQSVLAAYAPANYDETNDSGSLSEVNTSPIYYLSTTQAMSQIKLVANLAINGTAVQVQGSNIVPINVIQPFSNEASSSFGNQISLTTAAGPIAIYNPNQAGAQQSAAVSFDKTANYIWGVTRYAAVGNQVSYANVYVSNSPANLNVNSDGSASVPVGMTMVYGIPLVDVFGNLEWLNLSLDSQEG